jgi:RNA polymerase sigma factor (sigma-70 family)
MLNDQEATQLMTRFYQLRTQYQESGDAQIATALRRHEAICIDKFSYLVDMKTTRYKAYDNYEDLKQEGMMAMMKAMKSFKPNRGSFFSWAHHYIGTRVSRCANLHSTIRIPLVIAKEQAPHKELMMPVQIEEHFCPDLQVENEQDWQAARDVLDTLPTKQKEIVRLAFGFDGEPVSITKLCKQFGITRLMCLRTINEATLLMRDSIKI